MDHLFLKNGSVIFFAPHLDSRFSAESAIEFRFFAQGILQADRARDGGDVRKKSN